MRSFVRRLHPWQVLLYLLFAFMLWNLAVAPRAYAETALIHGQGRLFEVSREGAPASYVFGTMHVNDRRVLKLPGPIANALRKSRTVFLESGTENYDPRMALRSMMFSDGRTLNDVIKGKLYNEVMQAGLSAGFPRAVINQLKPGALLMLVGGAKSYHPWNVSRRPVLDALLLEFAVNHEIPVLQLDRAKEIFALFTKRLSEADQVALLRDAFDDDRVERPLDAMLEAYLEGDLDTLHSFGIIGNENLKDVEDRFDHELLYVRNHRWIPRLKPQLERGGVFIAVGAAHLSGEDGILHLLENEGFTVRRVH